MPDERFEADLRRRLRTEGEAPRLSLTAAGLERELAVRRRERAARRSMAGAAAVVAVVLVGVLAVGPGGLLRSAADVGASPTPPSMAPGASEPASPAAGTASPGPTGAPADEGALIELARIDLGGDDVRRVVDAPLPPGTDLVRVSIRCDQTSRVSIETYETITVACMRSSRVIVDIVPEDPGRADLVIVPSSGTLGEAQVLAFDRDRPVNGIVAPSLTLSSPADPGLVATAGCGMSIDGRAVDAPCAAPGPLLPEARRVVVVSRDPLTIEWPDEWIVTELRTAWTKLDDGGYSADRGPDNEATYRLVDSGIVVDTPSPGLYRYRFDVTAQHRASGTVISLPYWANLESQGRG